MTATSQEQQCTIKDVRAVRRADEVSEWTVAYDGSADSFLDSEIVEYTSIFWKCLVHDERFDGWPEVEAHLEQTNQEDQ